MPSLESVKDVRKSVPTIRRRKARYKYAVKHLSTDRPQVIPNIKRSKARYKNRQFKNGRGLSCCGESCKIRREPNSEVFAGSSPLDASVSHQKSKVGKRPLETSADVTAVKRCRNAEFEYEPKEISKVFKASTELRTGKVVCAWPGCGRKASSSAKLMIHLRQHAEGLTSRCLAEGCAKRFSCFAALFEHLRSHYAGAGHQCMRLGCTKNFATETKLTLHIYKHIDEYGIACPWAGCKIRNWDCESTLRHMATHCGHFPYHCDYEGCTEGFSNEKKARKHRICHLVHIIETPSVVRPSEQHAEVEHELNDKCRVELTGRSLSDCHNEGGNRNSEGHSEKRSFNRMTVQTANLPDEEKDINCDKNLHSPSISDTVRCTWLGCGEMYSSNSEFEEHFKIHTKTLVAEDPHINSFAIELDAQTDTEASGFERFEAPGVQTALAKANEVRPSELRESEISIPIQTKRVRYIAKPDVMPCTLEPHVECLPEPVSNATVPSIVSHKLGERVRACHWSDCSKVVEYEKDIREHVKSAHVREDCPHPNCNWVTTPYTTLAAHAAEHFSNQVLVCPWRRCGYIGNNINIVLWHMRKHHGRNQYYCSWTQCPKKFINKRGLRKHLKVDHKAYEGVPMFLCVVSECHKIYSTEEELQQHKNEYHQNHAIADDDMASAAESFLCAWPDCDVSVIGGEALAQHLRIHVRCQPETCPIEKCGMIFSTTRSLVLHVKVHYTDEVYTCPWNGQNSQAICQNRFTRVTDFIRHTRTHTKAKPYFCTWAGCNQSQSMKAGIVRHMMIHHSGVRPFVCDVEGCNERYATGYLLNRHSKTKHTPNVEELVRCAFDGCRETFPSTAERALHFRGLTAIEAVAIPQANSLATIFNAKSQTPHANSIATVIDAQTRVGGDEISPAQSLIQLKNSLGEKKASTPCLTATLKEEPNTLGIDAQPSEVSICLDDSRPEHITSSIKEQESGASNSYTEARVQEPIQCAWSNCDVVVATGDDLYAHLTAHVTLNPVTCPYQGCSLPFETEKLLRPHFASHFGTEPNICIWDGCNYFSEYQSHYLRHLLTHTKDRIYACSWLGCTETFNQMPEVKTHMMRRHSGVLPYGCTTSRCSKRYSTKGALAKHVGKMHTENTTEIAQEGNIKCTWDGCGIIVADGDALTNHLATHMHSLPVTCPVRDCGLSFLTNGLLVQHSASHFQKGRYSCDWEACMYYSPRLSDLVVHMRSHTKQPAYVCTWTGCEYSHHRYSIVSEHMLRMHSYVIPFVCAVEGCHKAYYVKQRLKRHMIHSHKWSVEKPLSFTWKDCRNSLRPARKYHQHEGVANDEGEMRTDSILNEQNIEMLTKEICTPLSAATDARLRYTFGCDCL